HPKIFWYRLVLAGALGINGDIDEARSTIAESLKLKPTVNSIAAWRDWLVSVRLEHPQFLALMDKTVGAGLRRAGFPAECPPAAISPRSSLPISRADWALAGQRGEGRLTALMGHSRGA